jgi:hypothetical protein
VTNRTLEPEFPLASAASAAIERSGRRLLFAGDNLLGNDT